METSKIQTLHPEKGKTNKIIDRDKYEIIKETILKILQNSEPTHSELVKTVTDKLNTSFNKNVSWYTMTVKLDLEARKIIGRTKSKPQKYRLKKPANHNI